MVDSVQRTSGGTSNKTVTLEELRRQIPYEPDNMKEDAIYGLNLLPGENYTEEILDTAIRDRISREPECPFTPNFQKFAIGSIKKIVLGTYTESDHEEYLLRLHTEENKASKTY